MSGLQSHNISVNLTHVLENKINEHDMEQIQKIESFEEDKKDFQSGLEEELVIHFPLEI